MKQLIKLDTTTIAFAALVAVAVSSCRVTSGGITNDSSKKNGASKIADVKVNLPASTQFKPSQGNATVNAIQVVVKPQNPSCVGATQINTIVAYDSPGITERFRKGCDYLVIMALGERAGTNGLMKAYYQSAETPVLASALEANPVNINLNLTLTADGQAAFMPASLAINPTPQPTPSNPPVPPNNGLAALDPKIAVNLNKVVGQNKQPVALASVFTTQYLVLDFSQPGCGPCMEHATEMNRPEYKERFSGSGKCSSIVMIEDSQIGDWQGLFNASTYVGSHSYSYSQGSNNRFSALFGGQNITGTPTFMIVDRSGKMLAQEVGRVPQEVDSLCR